MTSLLELGPMAPVLLMFVFGSVVLFVLALGGLLRSRRSPIHVPGNSVPAASVRYESPSDGLAAFLARIGNKAAESYKPSERNHVRNELLHAGFRNPVAIYIYYASRIGLAVTLPLVVGAFSYLVIGNIAANHLMMLLFGAAAVGLFLPSFWLSQRVKQRRTALQHSFPDALDMLLVCVEAGAGFAAALQRVSQELGLSHPVLADELNLVSAGLAAGQTKEDALQQFAQRAGTDDIAAFSTMMIQSELFGTSISETLRVQAADMRQQRMLRAEEMANKLPVKITLPLAMLIFPVLLIVILTPLVLRISEALKTH